MLDEFGDNSSLLMSLAHDQLTRTLLHNLLMESEGGKREGMMINRHIMIPVPTHCFVIIPLWYRYTRLHTKQTILGSRTIYYVFARKGPGSGTYPS